MNYECGCMFGPEDSWEACCPVHGMPMTLGTIDSADLAWAHHELSVRGVFTVDDLDNEG